MIIHIYNSQQEIVKTFTKATPLAYWLKRSAASVEHLITNGGGVVRRQGETYAVHIVDRVVSTTKKQECIKRRQVESCKQCLHHGNCEREQRSSN